MWSLETHGPARAYQLIEVKEKSERMSNSTSLDIYRMNHPDMMNSVSLLRFDIVKTELQVASNKGQIELQTLDRIAEMMEQVEEEVYESPKNTTDDEI